MSFDINYIQKFWDSVDPNITNHLAYWENKEYWVHNLDDESEITDSINTLLDSLLGIDPEFKTAEKCDDLLFILASMPLSHSLAALTFLEMEKSDDIQIGWDVASIMRADDIVREGDDHRLYYESRLLQDRISLTVKTKIANEIFHDKELFQRFMQDHENT